MREQYHESDGSALKIKDFWCPEKLMLFLVTETTQLMLSNDSGDKLRNIRFDETNILTGASSNERLVECQRVWFAKQQTTEGGLLLLTIFSTEARVNV